MRVPLDELYFIWLYRQVADARIKTLTHTYWRMLRLLFTKEFVWFVPNDDNRVEDGKDLRAEFVADQELNDADPGWLNLGCSMFELIIGLSRRLAFECEGEPRDWFWHLVENLDLHKFNDSEDTPEEYINEKLDQVIWRTYSYSGHGGLFPLEGPCEDQRGVEIWYQLSAYVLERI